MCVCVFVFWFWIWNFQPELNEEPKVNSVPQKPAVRTGRPTRGMFTLDYGKSKVHPCTSVQALRLCTGRTAYRGSRSVALPFHDHGTRRGWGVSVMPQPLFNPRKDLVPIVQEAGWAPGPVWTGAENLTLTRIRSLDRPVHSHSLYRLRYPAHFDCGVLWNGNYSCGAGIWNTGCALKKPYI